MATLAIGQTVGLRYRLDAELARGGMGAVYVATDKRLSRKVAIKVLLSELAGDTKEIERFERETTAVARINHPGIVQVLDVGHEGDAAFLVMEHVQGRTLSDVLGKDGKLDPMRAADIAEQALFAIGAAHALGIVHRDIKPGNLMLVPTGGREMVKLLDFGIAQLKTGTAYTRLTQTGAILGTPAFMAPEQARGQECDARTDVYAVGVLLWCMLTGKKPFAGRNMGDTITKVLSEVPMRADRLEPTVPAALAAICDKAMQKDPSARFASAQAFANALVELRTSPRVSQVPTPLRDRSQMATMITPEGTSVSPELVGAPRVSFVPVPPAMSPPAMATAQMSPAPSRTAPLSPPSAFVATPAASTRPWTRGRIALVVLAIIAATSLLTCVAFAIALRYFASELGVSIPGFGSGDLCDRAARCCQVLDPDDAEACGNVRLYSLQPDGGAAACRQLYDGYVIGARARGLTCD